MLQWIKKNHLHLIKAAILTTVFLGAAFLLMIPSTSAQNIADPSSTLNEGVKIIREPLGLPAFDIRLVMANIIRAALGLLGLVLVVLIMYAGYLWMTAGGNDEQISKSKAMLKNSVIGLAIILAAYSMVLFVMKLLGIGDGGNFTRMGAAPYIQQNFSGSGALGKIVKDHYPGRNEMNVPRNSKIVITFTKPILVSDFIIDHSGDGKLGNCKDSMTDWVSDCDRIITENSKLTDKFINITRSDTGEPIPAAAVVAVSSTVNKVPGIYTIVIKPITDLEKHFTALDPSSGGFLGDSKEKISYLVHLGSGLRLDTEGNPSAFESKTIGNDYYEWEFTCSTELDNSAPYVISVFPGNKAVEAKNSVIQIDFNEPIDPSGIQGAFQDGAGKYYFIEKKNIFAKSQNSTKPSGQFNLTNGYRTLEFVPDSECGINSCGNPIFCLPVCDKPGSTCKSDHYEMLLKAAQTINLASPEAIPFSGIMDLASNALDGNNNQKVESATTTGEVFPDWKVPDNFFWKFTLKDEIDASSPYLTSINPGIMATYITADYPWEMLFNKRMRVDSMYSGVDIEEEPTPAERKDNIPLCKVPRSTINDTATNVQMNHCPFLDKIKQEYFPILTSGIEDVHFNCFYPGKGPNKEASSETKLSPECKDDGSGCCTVTTTAVNQAFCCNGNVNQDRHSTSTCMEYLRSPQQ